MGYMGVRCRDFDLLTSSHSALSLPCGRPIIKWKPSVRGLPGSRAGCMGLANTPDLSGSYLRHVPLWFGQYFRRLQLLAWYTGGFVLDTQDLSRHFLSAPQAMSSSENRLHEADYHERSRRPQDTRLIWGLSFACASVVGSLVPPAIASRPIYVCTDGFDLSILMIFPAGYFRGGTLYILKLPPKIHNTKHTTASDHDNRGILQ